MVGSSNLTHGGLSDQARGNEERSLVVVDGTPPLSGSVLDLPIPLIPLLTQEDTMSRSVFDDLGRRLEARFRSDAKELSSDWLAQYERLLQQGTAQRRWFQARLVRLEQDPADASGLVDAGLQDPLQDWDTYLNALFQKAVVGLSDDALDQRLHILATARRVFADPKGFQKLSPQERLALAGIYKRMPGHPDVDWFLFAHVVAISPSMQALHAALTSEHVTPVLRKLQSALNAIPIEGLVSEDHFSDFALQYASLTECKGLCLPTRLLTLRRPDVFLAISKANLPSLQRLLKLTALNPHTLQDYWDHIIVPLRAIQARWLPGANRPGAESTREPMGEAPDDFDAELTDIWRARMALLDVLLWEPPQRLHP